MKKNNRQWKQALTVIGLAVMCTLMAGCGDDEPAPVAETGQARLRITAESINAGQTRTDAPITDPGTTEERSCNVLHIYYYKAATNGSLLAHQEVTINGAFPLEVEVPVAASSYRKEGKKVDIYVFASPAAGTMPTRPTRTDLQALMTSGMTVAITAGSGQLTYPNGTDRCIPMSGSIAGHDFEAKHFAELLLRRAVAKFRIRVQNDITPTTGTTIDLLTDRMTLKLANLRAQSPLQPLADGTYTPGSIGTFASQTFNAAATAGTATAFVPQTTTDTDGSIVTWLHTAYANEHLFDVSAGVTPPANCGMMEINLPYTIKKNGVLTTTEENNLYSIPLDFPLKRNFIYQITVHVYGFGKKDVKIEVKVLPWNIETALPGESGRGFDLKGQVIMKCKDGVERKVVCMGIGYYASVLNLRQSGILLTGDDAMSDLKVSCSSDKLEVSSATVIGHPDIQIKLIDRLHPVIDSNTELEEATLTVSSKSVPAYSKEITIFLNRVYVGGIVWLDRNIGDQMGNVMSDPTDVQFYQPGMINPRPAKRAVDTPQGYTKGKTPCPVGYTIPTAKQWTDFFHSISNPFYYRVGSSVQGDFNVSYSTSDLLQASSNVIIQLSTNTGVWLHANGYRTSSLPGDTHVSYATRELEYTAVGYYLTMEGNYVRVGLDAANAFQIVPFATYASDVRYANIRCIKETD